MLDGNCCDLFIEELQPTPFSVSNMGLFSGKSANCEIDSISVLSVITDIQCGLKICTSLSWISKYGTIDGKIEFLYL